MDVREKLVELLKDAQIASVDKCHTYEECKSCPNDGQGILCRVPFSVDHLISHGVTMLPVQVGDTSEHMSQLKERIEKNSSWDVCGNELKPCPFCECEIIIAEINYLNKTFRIHCEECPAEMELSFADAQIGNGEFISFYEMQKIITEMVEHWNRRANEQNNGC